MIVDRKTFRKAVNLAPEILGYCDPLQSDFDDVLNLGVVTGRMTEVVVGEKVKDTKKINSKATVTVSSEHGTVFIAGDGKELTVDEAIKIIPEHQINELQNALSRNLRSRKNNLQRTKHK